MTDGAKTGGGIRPPDYLRELALADLEDLMAQGMPWPKIRARLAESGYTESDETAKKWRHEILRRWAADDAEVRPAYKDMWRARLECQYHQLATRAAKEEKSAFAFASLHAEMTRIAKVAIVLDNLTAPVAPKVDGKPSVSSMSPTEREREIRDLMERREAARRLHGGN